MNKAILLFSAILVFSRCSNDKVDKADASQAVDAALSSDASSTAVDASASRPDASSADAMAAQADCTAWCTTRAPHIATDGWCLLGVDQLPPQTCKDVCRDASKTGELNTLQMCIEEDPLCFQTLEVCRSLI